MSFTDIKTKSQGFTIVELLIVVVVIAILAAITIVSYTGITNRANAATSKETASNLQKKIETFAADGTTGNYPTTLSSLTASGNSWTTPALWNTDTTGGKTVNMAPNGTISANLVQYQVCGYGNSTTVAPTAITGAGNTLAAGAVTGYKVNYWDFSASPASLQTFSAGNTSGTVNTFAVGCLTPTS